MKWNQNNLWYCLRITAFLLINTVFHVVFSPRGIAGKIKLLLHSTVVQQSTASWQAGKSNCGCSCNMLHSNSGCDLYLQQINAPTFVWGSLAGFYFKPGLGPSHIVHKAPSSTSFNLFWDCQGAVEHRAIQPPFGGWVQKYIATSISHLFRLTSSVKGEAKN